MKNSTKTIMLLFTFLMVKGIINAQISGNKTIGGASPDYTTINDAITALKINGINGDVIFNIRDGVYNEILDISNISGSQTYSIIFQSESQDTSKVKITYTATSGNTYLVNLTKIKNITFKNLSFWFTGNYTCRMVNMYDSVVNIKFQNNYFKCLNTNAYIVYAPQPQYDEKAPRMLEFTQNTFESGYSALELYGGYYGIINNLIVTNNIIKNQKNNGIYFSSCQGISIKSNSITSIKSTNYDVSAFGIGLEYAKDFEVSNNVVYSSFCYGILLKNCSNTSLLKRVISNNFVTTKIDPYGMSGKALNIEGTDYADIIFNSLRLIGGDTGMTSYGLSVSGCSNINVVNNIIHNNETYAVNLDSKTGISTWDYNYLFGSSTYFAKYNNTTYSSLNAWQSASTLDVHSVTGTLTFVSASDLHVNSTVVNNKGTVWASILTDIDNETRSLSTPDMGADEFTIATDVNDLSYDQSLLIYPNPSNGIIYIKQESLLNNKIELQIYSITGKLILNEKNLQINKPIDLSHFSGILNAKIIMNNKIYNQKILIQK
jgi:parallel beta-helix repeat protein